MHSTPDPNPDSRPFAWGLFARVARYTKVVVFLALAVLAPYGGQAFGPSPARTYSVILTWDESLDEGIVAHRVYYGVASGQYTDTQEVENGTTTTVEGLQAGVRYYFVLTAVHWSGLESEFSDEIDFMPGPHRITIGPGTTGGGATGGGATGTLALTINGVVGQRYDIEATQDFDTWTFVATVTVGRDGCVEFSDPAAAQFPARFYRTRRTPE